MPVKYPGKNGLVYLSTSGTTSASSVGGFRAFTFDGTTEKIDVTSFGATNRESVQSFPATRGTIEGFWLSDDTVLRQAAASSDGCHLYMYPSSNAITKWVGGPAWIDFSLATTVDGAVTTSATFEARGAWTNQL